LLGAGHSIVSNASRNPSLHRLEQGILLAGRWVAAESGRRRRVYALTRRGERALASHCAVWQQFSNAIGCLLAGTLPIEEASVICGYLESLAAALSFDRSVSRCAARSRKPFVGGRSGRSDRQ
jgi:DNA-binding PadR family transcriptional regulator